MDDGTWPVARITEQEVERLRREVSVERLVEAHGVKLRRDHDKLVGTCPFHDDGEHALVVTPKANTWSCPECKGGSGIEWVMKLHGVSFRHAAEMLRKDEPAMLAPTTEPTTTTSPPKKTTTTKLPKLVTVDADNAQLLVRVVDYYHATLNESPEALGYLTSRGLNNPEMVERFKIGFANRTLGYRLPQKNRREGAQLRGRLERLGIFRDTGHEHFNGSIVIPIFDANGAVVLGMYGRKITGNLRAGTSLHLYAPEPPRGVWNELGLTGGEVVITKSVLDALTFWCAGIRNVTTTFGRDGLPDDHREALSKYGVKRAFLAFERSKVGDAATAKLGAELNALGIETFRLLFPSGMDANDYARSGGAAEKLLTAAIRNAEWMGKRHEAEVVPTALDDEREDVEPVVPTAAEPAPAIHTPPTPSPGMATSIPNVTTTTADEIVFTFGDRCWRVRGLDRNTSHGDLRVNLLVSREGAGFHLDTVDLYSAKQRAAFVKQTAIEIAVTEEVVKKELGAVLLDIEGRVDEQIRARLEPIENKPTMTEAERDEALALLRDPKLVDRIVSDFESVGLVGEDTNKLLGYIAAVSRKLDEPLAVVVQSSSAAGKSSLMEAVLDFVPEEERVSFSAMTGQSLYYMGERDLRHRVLAVAEGEGAERASYPLKLLQSEGQLTIASTGKDPTTGKLVAHEYKVAGPVATFLTTTAIELDEELMNRCLVLTVDEGREQTRRVHERQRKSQTLAGLLARRDRDRVVRLHRNAQRLLQPVVVVNPFAESLSFTDGRTRSRRDHMKFLGLIRAVALLHQHQREWKGVEHESERIEYIEVVAADIELTTRLLANVLVRPEDELSPVTANILATIEALVNETAKSSNLPASEVRFTQRQIRERTGAGHTRLKMHMKRLEEQEYVIVHKGGRGQVRVYGLVGADWSPRDRPPVAPWSASGADRGGVRDDTASPSSLAVVASERDHVKGVLAGNVSYPR